VKFACSDPSGWFLLKVEVIGFVDLIVYVDLFMNGRICS